MDNQIISDLIINGYRYLDSKTLLVSGIEPVSFYVCDETDDKLKVNLVFLNDDVDKQAYTRFQAKSKNEVDVVIANTQLVASLGVDKVPFGTYNDKDLFFSMYIDHMRPTTLKLITINLFVKEKEDGKD